MFLPKPLLSNDDIVIVQDSSRRSASLIWNAWSKDPIKAAFIRAILACMESWRFRADMAIALHQAWVCFTFIPFIGSGGSALLKRFQPSWRPETEILLKILQNHPDIWRSPVSNAQ